MVFVEFDSYKILHRSEPYTVPGKGTYTKNSIQVDCFNNGNPVGALIFHDTTSASTQNSLVNDRIILHYNTSLFNFVYNTIRYEKPLWLVLNTTSWSGYLGTKDIEPTGDED
jgi:hypothetical protein